MRKSLAAIIVILLVVIGAAVVYYNLPTNEANLTEDKCISSGGTVEEITCFCEGVEDFFDNCEIGVCTCNPIGGESHIVRICNCGEGRCFDGETCGILDFGECETLYWHDDENISCGQKEFCGLYMYEGLKTFETLEECKADTCGFMDCINAFFNQTLNECQCGVK